MKNIINMSLMVALITILTINFAACGSDDDKDMTPPAISADGIVANPVNCQQYHPGDIIPFHYIMTDNQELGNYNIEIHNNFDHHSHSTEADDHDHDHEMGECDDHDEDVRRPSRYPDSCRYRPGRLPLHDSTHRPCRLATTARRSHQNNRVRQLILNKTKKMPPYQPDMEDFL